MFYFPYDCDKFKIVFTRGFKFWLWAEYILPFIESDKFDIFSLLYKASIHMRVAGLFKLNFC